MKTFIRAAVSLLSLSAPVQIQASLLGPCPRAVRIVSSDPPRNEAHPARNRQLVIPSGPAVPALGRPAEMNALMMQAAGPGPHRTAPCCSWTDCPATCAISMSRRPRDAPAGTS